MLSPIIRYIRDWQRYGRDVQELSRMSDHELADIGISRCDIRRIAQGAIALESRRTATAIRLTGFWHAKGNGQNTDQISGRWP